MVKMIILWVFYHNKKKKTMGGNICICLFVQVQNIAGWIYLRNVKRLTPTEREYGWLENLEGRLDYTPFLLLKF